jgi:hypothetical protein
MVKRGGRYGLTVMLLDEIVEQVLSYRERGALMLLGCGRAGVLLRGRILRC